MSDKTGTKIIDGALCINTSALCDVLDIHRNTLAQWDKAGMPKKARGWYELKLVIPWVMENRGVKKAPSSEEGQSWLQQKQQYEAILKEQQAEAATMKNEIAKGVYIRRDDVVGELQRFLISLRRSMMGFSRKIAMEVSPYLETDQVRAIEQQVSGVTLDVLQQLSVKGVYHAKRDK